MGNCDFRINRETSFPVPPMSRGNSGGKLSQERSSSPFLIPCHLQKRKCCSIGTAFQTKKKYDGSSDDVVTTTETNVRKIADTTRGAFRIHCNHFFILGELLEG